MYSQEREEAIKRVPANVDVMIRELESKIGDSRHFADSIHAALQTKLSIEEFDELMVKKVDVAVFEEWFPPAH